MSKILLAIVIVIGINAKANPQDINDIYLIAAWADHSDELVLFRQDLNSVIAVSGTTRYFNDQSQQLALYVVQPPLKGENLEDLFTGERDTVSFLKIPIEKVRVRTFVTLIYETGFSLANPPSEMFWIGDSKALSMPAISIKGAGPLNVSTFIPGFNDCKNVNSDCLKAMVAAGYFSQPTIVNGDIVDPFSYLRSALQRSTDLREYDPQIGHFQWNYPLATFKSVIKDIILTNEIWTYSVPHPDTAKLSSFYDKNQRQIIDFNTRGVFLVKTPIQMGSAHIDSKVRDNPLEMALMMEYLSGALSQVSQVNEPVQNH